MEKTLNLKDNPFDPELPLVGRASGEPLRPDTYENSADEPRKALRDRLRELLCMEIAGMAAAERTLLKALFRDKDPTLAPIDRKNAILMIIGPHGSGRSTLANRIAGLVMQRNRTGAANEKWERFELLLGRHLPLPPPDLLGALEKKRNEIIGQFANRSGRVLLLIDDLPTSSFKFILNAFDGLPQLNRIFIVTTTDTELMQNDELDASGIHIERAELTRLTAEEIRAFIKDRIPKFRAGNIPALQTNPDLSLFPFADSFALEMAVKPKPLQMIRTVAYKRIDERHEQLSRQPQLVDAAVVEPNELRARLIQR